MAPRFALLVLLLSLLPLVLPHSIRLPSAPCAARIAARSLEGRGAHRVLRTSLRVTCRADILRPRHSVDAHVACGETSATRTGSRGLNVNDGETERGRAVRGDEEWHTDGCRAVPEQRADLSSCNTADEHMGSSGAAGRTRVTIRLEQPIPRGLFADPFELERIVRPGVGAGELVGAWDGEKRERMAQMEWAAQLTHSWSESCDQPAGDRAWVVGPVELEQPAPRCEATVALMERDPPFTATIPLSPLSHGPSPASAANHTQRWSSQPAPADGKTDLSAGAAGLGGDSEGAEAAAAEGRRDEERGEEGEEGALLWEVPAGCAAHTPVVLWGTSLAAAVGALSHPSGSALDQSHPVGSTGLEPSLWERTGPEPSLWERTGPEPSLRERTGPEPSLWERTGPMPSLWERTGPEPSLWERTGPEPSLRERTGPMPSLWECTGPEPSLWDRTGPEPSLRERHGPEPSLGCPLGLMPT
ncbi:unnamed protein product [Closterium sp. NIES-64]|nr:unnamed protein product [Closterium sp. NIES-64]